jgi:hypothetical protein
MSARQGVCQENPPPSRAATDRTSSHSLISRNVLARSRHAIELRFLRGVSGEASPQESAPLAVILLPEASPQCDGGLGPGDYYSGDGYYGEDRPWSPIANPGYEQAFHLIVVDTCNGGKTIYTSQPITVTF